MDLTDEQCAVIELLISEANRKSSGLERPLQGAWELMHGIVRILRTDAHWQVLPDRYPAYQICHRRFQ